MLKSEQQNTYAHRILIFPIHTYTLLKVMFNKVYEITKIKNYLMGFSVIHV